MTDPTDPDTDDDGESDGAEVAAGTDPTEDLWVLAALWRRHRFAIGLAVAGLVVAGLAVAGLAVLVRRRDAVQAALARVSGQRGTGGSESAEVASAAPDGEEALTNEGRVLQLLAENDGRLPQSEIVERTGWSKAKVSRLLSRMEENGDIRKISVGRGNLIAIPGHEPEHARPPFEENDD